MKMYNEMSSTLKEGQKITLITFGEFGFLGMSQTVFNSVKPKQHYQNCPENMIGVELIHKPKSKRTSYRKIIDYNNSVLIYDGWCQIDLDKIQYNYGENTKPKLFEFMRSSKYPCFDERYFQDVLKTVKNKPILSINC